MSSESPRITHSDTQTYRRHVEETADFLRDRAGTLPTRGLVIEEGLDELAAEIKPDTVVPYRDIPHVADGADGQITVGTLEGTPLVAAQKPLHLHDGYTPRQVAFPIRVLATVGVDTLLFTNVAGGLNAQFEPSDVMLVTDHINFQGANPLVGPNVDDWGPRFPDMSEPYDPDLRDLAKQTALDAGIPLQQGVYLSVLGPNLETKAEYRMLRSMGADAIGTSMVPEVIAARHMDVRVLALSAITDQCLPDALKPVSVDDLQSAADAAVPILARLLRGVASALP